MYRTPSVLLYFALSTTLSACAASMPSGPPSVDISKFTAGINAEAAVHNRPDPLERKVDLSRSQLIGESRTNVLQELGTPMGVVKDGNNSCDAYLYTPGQMNCARGGSCSISQKLTEALTPPVFTTIYSYSAPHGASCSAVKCEKHMVLICYGPDNNLTELREYNSA